MSIESSEWAKGYLEADSAPRNSRGEFRVGPPTPEEKIAIHSNEAEISNKPTAVATHPQQELEA